MSSIVSLKISVITVCYNCERTINDCLASVYRQTWPNVEHIIIDGASTDNTIKLIKSTSNRVKHILSEPDDGIYDAMNKGVALSSGDIIGILNSDDYYASETILEQIANSFIKQNCDAVFGNIDFVDSRNVKQVIRHWKSSPYTNNAFQSGWHPPHPAFYVKKTVYDKYGVYNTSLNVSADFEFMLRVIEKHNIKTHYINTTIVKMRYGGESTGSIKKIIVGNKNIMKAFKINSIPVSPWYPLKRIISKVGQFFKRQA